MIVGHGRDRGAPRAHVEPRGRRSLQVLCALVDWPAGYCGRHAQCDWRVAASGLGVCSPWGHFAWRCGGRAPARMASSSYASSVQCVVARGMVGHPLIGARTLGGGSAVSLIRTALHALAIGRRLHADTYEAAGCLSRCPADGACDAQSHYFACRVLRSTIEVVQRTPS